MKKLLQLIIAFFFSCVLNTSGQSITINDGAEITSQAEALIEAYQNLLNTISNTDIKTNESELVIENCYAENNYGRIFWDANVIVEDDLDPLNSTPENAVDIPIERYLKNIEIIYTKTKEPSITFYNIYPSNIKKRDEYYILVYFDSKFESKHKKSNVPFKLVRRVAEVKAKKVDEQWIAHIAGIRYYSKEDSLNESQYEVELIASESTLDMISNATHNINLKYLQFIKAGDQALALEDYEAAEVAYEQAFKLKPNSQHPQRKLKEIREKDWYSIYYKEGLKAERIRDYNTAVTNFKKARDLKLTDTKVQEEIEDKLAKLNAYIRSRDLFISHYNSGKYDDIINEYSRRLKSGNLTDYEAAEHHFRLGRSYESKGNSENALKEYSLAINKDIYFDNALLHRAEINQKLYYSAKEKEKQRHLQEAQADFTVLISNNPKIADNYNKRASVRILLFDYDGALKDYDKAIEIQPTKATSYYNKALLFLNQYNNDYKNAHLNLNLAIKQDSAFADAYFEKGKIEYLSMGDLVKAAESFSYARKNGLNPSSVIVIKAYSTKHYNEGVSFYKIKNYNDAIIKFKEAIILNPENYHSYLMIGEANMEKNDLIAAIENYSRALVHNKDLHLAYLKRGKANFELGEYKQANEDFNLIVSTSQSLKNINFIEAYIWSSKSQQALQNYEIAITSYQEIINLIKREKSKLEDEISDKNPALYVSMIPFDADIKLSEIYNYMGQCNYELKNYKQAVKDLSESISSNKANSEAYFNRGLVYFASADYKKSIKDITASLAKGEPQATKFFARAQSYQMLHKHLEAIEDFKSTLVKDSALFDAYYLGGKSLATLNNNKDALTFYNFYFKSKGTNELTSNFFAERGIIHLKLNSFENAKNDFDQALSLEASNGEALYGLGCNYALQNNIEEALNWFQKAFITKTINKARIKKDTPLLLASIAKDKRFKKLVKSNL